MFIIRKFTSNSKIIVAFDKNAPSFTFYNQVSLYNLSTYAPKMNNSICPTTTEESIITSIKLMSVIVIQLILDTYIYIECYPSISYGSLIYSAFSLHSFKCLIFSISTFSLVEYLSAALY